MRLSSPASAGLFYWTARDCFGKGCFSRQLHRIQAVSEEKAFPQESALQFTLSSPSTPYWCRHCFSVSTDTVLPVSASNRA